MKILFVFLIAFFWISLGLTEGWKWRSEYGKPDDHKLINKSKYHNWRFLTNSSFILLPFISCFNFLTVVSANLVGWVLYERFMSYTIYDDFFRQKKEDFLIFGKSIKRWPIALEWTCFAFGVILLIFSR